MKAPLPTAFIFDMNGTMINDMEYHTQAWFDVLNHELNANLSWEEVKREMYGKNEELLVRVFGKGRFTPEEMTRLSWGKETKYQEAFRPHLKLINGLDRFLETAAAAGIRMAIGTAAIRMNVDFVLDGLNLRHYFDAIVTADDVVQSKPDPETFLKAAQLLHCAPAGCMVFEDAPKGVEAAQNAGMQSVVLTTMHPEGEFAAYADVRAVVSDYTNPVLDTLFENVSVS